MKWLTFRERLGASEGEGNGQNGVAAEPTFVRRAVKSNKFLIQTGLFPILTDKRRRNFTIDIGARLGNAGPAVARGGGVALLRRLMLAGGSAGGRGCSADRTVGQSQ